MQADRMIEADQFLYDGHDFDREVGLQYNAARHYDPETGRWLNLDPIAYEAPCRCPQENR